MEEFTWVIVRRPNGTVYLEYIFPDDLEEFPGNGVSIGDSILPSDPEVEDRVVAVLDGRVRDFFEHLHGLAQNLHGEGRQQMRELLNDLLEEVQRSIKRDIL